MDKPQQQKSNGRQQQQMQLQLDISQREKHQAKLFSQYTQAMKLLKSKHLNQGQQILQQILSSPVINQAQLRKLKKSVILSMANIFLLKQQKPNALAYYYHALQLQRRIIRDQQQQQSALMIDTNTTGSQQYMLLMKMYELSMSLGYERQSLYLLKNAIIVSPSMWRQKLLRMLQNVYDNLGLHQELEDLRGLKNNVNLMKKVIKDQQYKLWRRCKVRVSNSNQQTKMTLLNEQQQHNNNSIMQQQQQQLLNNLSVINPQLQNKAKPLKQLKITIPQQQSCQYSHFQYLLTVCYVLLKCQHQKRNFNKKRYLHKKYDNNNLVWIGFLNQFDLMRTKLEIVYDDKKQGQEDLVNRRGSVIINVDEKQQESLSMVVGGGNQLVGGGNQQLSVGVSKQSLMQENNPIANKVTTHQQIIQQLTTQLLRIKYTKKKKPTAATKLHQQLLLQNKQKQLSTNINNAQQNEQQSQQLPIPPTTGTKPTSKKYSSSNTQQQHSFLANNKLTVYQSVSTYLRQVMEKNELKKEQLQWLKQLDQNMYEKLWKNTLQVEDQGRQQEGIKLLGGTKNSNKDRASSNYNSNNNNRQQSQTQQKPTTTTKQQQQSNINSSQIQYVSSENQQITTTTTKKLTQKDKKQLQLKKIAYHNKLFTQQFMQKINIKKNDDNIQGNFSSNKQFINCYQLLQHLIKYILEDEQRSLLSKQKKQNQSVGQLQQLQSDVISMNYYREEFALFNNQSVRRLMSKCLLKVIMVDGKWLDRLLEYSSINMINNQHQTNINTQDNKHSLSYNKLLISQLLITHYQHMSFKQPKQTQFTPHQQFKLSFLQKYIQSKFSLTLYLLKQQQNQHKSSITNNYLMLLSVQKLLMFYTCVGTFNVQMVHFYRQLWRINYNKLKKILTQTQLLSTTQTNNKNNQPVNGVNGDQIQNNNNNNNNNNNFNNESLSLQKKAHEYVKSMSQSKIDKMINDRKQKVLEYSLLLANANINSANTSTNVNINNEGNNNLTSSLIGSAANQLLLPKPQLSEIDSILLMLESSSAASSSNKQQQSQQSQQSQQQQPQQLNTTTEHIQQSSESPQKPASTLQRIISHLESFFTKLQQQSLTRQQFTLKQLQQLSKSMKIQQLITKLYNKFKNVTGSGIVKQFQSLKQNNKEMLLGLLIKLCVIGVLGVSDDCLRILFYLTNCYIKQTISNQDKYKLENQQQKQTHKNQQQKQKQQQQQQQQSYSQQQKSSSPLLPTIHPQTILTYKLIILYKSLIDFSEKRQKLQSYSLVLRKLYQNIIGKNLNIIYQGTREQWGRLMSKWKQVQDQGNMIEEEEIIGEEQMQGDIREDNIKNNIKINPTTTINNNHQQHSQQQYSKKIMTTSITRSYQQYLTLHASLNPILHQIYHSQQSQFHPKRIQDSLGYFIYLSRYFYQQFQSQQQVQLSTHVMKMFRQCYRLYYQKQNQVVKCCERFKQMLIKIERYFDGLDKQSQEVMNILKGVNKLCDCCCNSSYKSRTMTIGSHFFYYSQIVYILARLFQSNPQIEQSTTAVVNTTNTTQLVVSSLNDSNNNPLSSTQLQLDEQYYRQYLLININKPHAWARYIRIQCRKGFLYFDSLVGVQPIDMYKNKFLFTKRVINFVKLYVVNNSNSNKDSNNKESNNVGNNYQSNQVNMMVNQQQQHQKQQNNPTNHFTNTIKCTANQQQIQKLRHYSIRTLNTLNILKMKQRQFLMTMKSQQSLHIFQSSSTLQIPTNNKQSKQIKQYKQLTKKYLQGLKTIKQKYDPQQSITSIYLGLIEIEIPQIKHKLITQFKVNNNNYNNSNSRIIQEMIQQVKSLSLRIRQLISKLGQYQSKQQHAIHLQQDLIVEYYMLLCRLIQKIVDYVILVKKYIHNNTLQQQQYKQRVLQKIDEFLNYVITQQSAIGNNPRYKLLIVSPLLAQREAKQQQQLQLQRMNNNNNNNNKKNDDSNENKMQQQQQEQQKRQKIVFQLQYQQQQAIDVDVDRNEGNYQQKVQNQQQLGQNNNQKQMAIQQEQQLEQKLDINNNDRNKLIQEQQLMQLQQHNNEPPTPTSRRQFRFMPLENSTKNTHTSNQRVYFTRGGTNSRANDTRNATIGSNNIGSNCSSNVNKNKNINNNDSNSNNPKKNNTTYNKKQPQPTINIMEYYKQKISTTTQQIGNSTKDNNNNNNQSLLINDTLLTTTCTQICQQIISKCSRIINSITSVFKSLPKYQLKRYKYRRSVTQSLLYTSVLYLKYSITNKQHALDIIKDYYNIRSDDIVFVFTHSDRNKSTQKNVQLAEYYTRALVHNLQRYWFIRHLIDCFYEIKNIQSLIVLLRKLNKLLVVEQNKQIHYLVMLYCYGVDKYLKLVQQVAKNTQLQQRYEKLLLEFRNKIRKSVQLKIDTKKIQSKVLQKQKQQQQSAQQQQLVPSNSVSSNVNNMNNFNIMVKQAREKAIKQNYYFDKIDRFIKQYEQRYQRKVKLKKSKKQRELQKQLKEKQQKQKQLKQKQLKQKQKVKQVGQNQKEMQIQGQIQIDKSILEVENINNNQIRQLQQQQKQQNIQLQQYKPIYQQQRFENEFVQLQLQKQLEKQLEKQFDKQLERQQRQQRQQQPINEIRQQLTIIRKKQQLKQKKQRKSRQQKQQRKKKKQIINLQEQQSLQKPQHQNQQYQVMHQPTHQHQNITQKQYIINKQQQLQLQHHQDNDKNSNQQSINNKKQSPFIKRVKQQMMLKMSPIRKLSQAKSDLQIQKQKYRQKQEQKQKQKQKQKEKNEQMSHHQFIVIQDQPIMTVKDNRDIINVDDNNSNSNKEQKQNNNNQQQQQQFNDNLRKIHKKSSQ